MVLQILVVDSQRLVLRSIIQIAQHRLISLNPGGEITYSHPPHQQKESDRDLELI